MLKEKKFWGVMKFLVYPILFIYLEIVYKLSVKSDFSFNFVYPCISAITLGVIIFFLSSLTKKIVNRIIGYALVVGVCVLFIVQIVYTNTFIAPFSISIAFGGAEGVAALTEFKDLTITAVCNNALWIVMCLLPIVAVVFADIKLGIFDKQEKKGKIYTAIVAVGIHIVGLLSLLLSGNNGYSAKVLYYDQFVIDIGFEKLGVITSMKIDFKYFLFGAKENLEEITEKQEIPDLGQKPTNKVENNETTSSEQTTSENETTAGEEQTEEPTTVPEEPIVYEPNVLNIDLDSFSANTSDSNIQWLNDYIEACEPTYKNEYTGMFEGYNLILLTAESFSPWAVSEKYTPTLYMLVNSGFVFNNFYLHGWTATTQGEYILCTGLLGNGRGAASPFENTIDKYMGMCMGNTLRKYNYSTFAYHNHTYTYYNRDETHPNMGYEYKGNGTGVDIPKTWPESDLQMMEVTMDEYINEEQFHAYYMTVSGHKDYTFIDNSMSNKNRDLVADLDATNEMKAYVACNIELDKALEYIINRLEEKGIADKTVIAFAADHYPYGLKDQLVEEIGEEANKWYGLQKSNLVIWSASMEETVYVDKVCSSVDIIPTLLNLMGIEYDSRLYSGRDILSNSPGLVVFNDMGFMTDYCIYNSKLDEVKQTTDIEVPNDYVNQINSLVKNQWNAAGKIIQVDYYKKMQEYLKD